MIVSEKWHPDSIEYVHRGWVVPLVKRPGDMGLGWPFAEEFPTNNLGQETPSPTPFPQVGGAITRNMPLTSKASSPFPDTASISLSRCPSTTNPVA